MAELTKKLVTMLLLGPFFESWDGLHTSKDVRQSHPFSDVRIYFIYHVSYYDMTRIWYKICVGRN